MGHVLSWNAEFVYVVIYITVSAVSQAVSRRLPTVTSRVQAQVRSCGICGGQIGTGAGFIHVLSIISCQSFHRLLHTYHPSSGAGTVHQIVADVPSGLGLTPTQETCYKEVWEGRAGAPK
jgi:hypothetical protein